MSKRVFMLAVAVVAGLTLVAAPAYAKSPDDVAALSDKVITSQLAKYQIPGAAVVVVANGKQVFGKGYGQADTSTHTPVTVDDTSFFMASVAKTFTADAVLQLVADGRLDPHADVNKYLTGFKVADTYPGRPVTLHHLLTHTSGFADTPLGVAVPDPASVPPLGSWLRAHQPPRVRPPGTLTSYDNYGFALAGYIVEQVSGQPFATYVDQHILRPLKMTGTTFQQPHPASLPTQPARGYQADGRPAQGQYGAMSPTGAGTVTTAADMGRFMLAQLRPGNQATTQQFAQEPRLPGMGYAYEQHLRGSQRVVTKDGDVPGFHDRLELIPDAGIGIFVVYNGDGVDGSATFAGRDLIDQIVDRLYPTVDNTPSTTGTDPGAFAGVYRTTRYSHDDFTKFAVLTSSVAVKADGAGLTTTGLSSDPANPVQHWRPIQPGVFANGLERIAFRDGVLFTTADPTAAYQRLPWYATPMVHEVVAGIAMLVLLVALFWWPIAALIRRRSPSGRLPRLATLTGWLTAALMVGFVAALVDVLSDSAALNGHILLNDSALLTTSLVLVTVAAVTTVGMVVATSVAWLRGWWGRAGRLGYTTATAAAIAVVAIGAAYNLIG